MSEIQIQERKSFDLSPQNFDQALTFAQYLADSDMVPKDFKGKPGNCLLAMQWGSEIGLKPLQAIQNIAVINGRPSIWGDTLIALARSSPLCEHIIESATDTVATCKVKRRGEPEQIRTFSMDDAAKAGLKGKPGPWSQYPKRMMQMRARAFALRDVFPDVLKGISVVEEARDEPQDLGQVQEVISPEKLALIALIESATNSANQGVATYSAFWKECSADDRKAIGKEKHNELKEQAAKADAERTVEEVKPQEVQPDIDPFIAALEADQ